MGVVGSAVPNGLDIRHVADEGRRVGATEFVEFYALVSLLGLGIFQSECIGVLCLPNSESAKAPVLSVRLDVRAKDRERYGQC